jgi:hypothetical protein
MNTKQLELLIEGQKQIKEIYNQELEDILREEKKD